MITYKRGNLLNDDSYALVNTVNTVGVMGKGIALAFKKAFPDNYLLYRTACLTGQVRIGELFIVPDSNLLMGERLIINLPTKKDWRNPSEYSYVEQGLQALARYLSDHVTQTLALPALGCGNGGLEWTKIKGMINQYLASFDTDIRIYGPE